MASSSCICSLAVNSDSIFTMRVFVALLCFLACSRAFETTGLLVDVCLAIRGMSVEELAATDCDPLEDDAPLFSRWLHSAEFLARDAYRRIGEAVRGPHCLTVLIIDTLSHRSDDVPYPERLPPVTAADRADIDQKACALTLMPPLWDPAPPLDSERELWADILRQVGRERKRRETEDTIPPTSAPLTLAMYTAFRAREMYHSPWSFPLCSFFRNAHLLLRKLQAYLS